jgi:hypothetical protein
MTPYLVTIKRSPRPAGRNCRDLPDLCHRTPARGGGCGRPVVGLMAAPSAPGFSRASRGRRCGSLIAPSTRTPVWRRSARSARPAPITGTACRPPNPCWDTWACRLPRQAPPRPLPRPSCCTS